MPRRSDGYAMCRSVNARCTCEETASGPCDAWIAPVGRAVERGLDIAQAERDRIAFNATLNRSDSYPTAEHRDFAAKAKATGLL